MDLFVGKMGSSLCPVSTKLNYLCIRGMLDRLLFKLDDGRVLTRQCFVSAVHIGMEKAGIDSSKEGTVLGLVQ